MISQKYKFDYYLSRVGVLSEMAAIDKKLVGAVPGSNVGNIAYQLRKRVGDIMKNGNIENSNGDIVAGFPQNIRADRVLKYFLYMVERMDTEDDTEDDTDRENSENISDTIMIQKSKEILGIPNEDNYKSYNLTDTAQLFRAATVKSVQNNKEYVESPEFAKKLLDTTTIADYMTTGRTTQTVMSHLRKDQLEARHGQSIEDIHSAEMSIKDKISKINRETAYKRLRKYNETAIGSESGPVVNCKIILLNLESFIAYKKVLDGILGINFENLGAMNITTYDKIVSFNEMLERPLPESVLLSLTAMARSKKTGDTFLNDLYEDFRLMLEDGITQEDFIAQMDDYASFMDATYLPFIKYFKNTLEDESDSEEFPGYDMAILDKYLESEDDWIKFANYYEFKENEAQYERTKQSLPSGLEGFGDWKNILPEVRRGFEKFSAKWNLLKKGKSGSTGKSQVDDLDIDDDFITQSLSKSTPKTKKSSPYNDGEDNDDDYYKESSYIMGYMVEQISKDRFSPKGEFKDRGFKKANYDQWLRKNR